VTSVVETFLERRYGEGYEDEETIPLDSIDVSRPKISILRSRPIYPIGTGSNHDMASRIPEMIQREAGQEDLIHLNIA
jgi:hypothetical protein